MFVILYRWRIKTGKEAQFIKGWSEITSYYRENFDSLGSRLHRGDDGIFYAYAQWKTAENRNQAFADSHEFESAKLMREAIEERFAEVKLEIVEDYLLHEKNY